MAEHSMCHPGRPGPQGEGHDGSPSLADFLCGRRHRRRGARSQREEESRRRRDERVATQAWGIGI
jgi:hypothetical protein